MIRLRRHRLALAATLATALFASSVAATPKPIPMPADAVVVTVPTQDAAGERVIPPGFLGLSFENSAIIPYAGRDPNALDPVFVRLVRNLTPHQSPVLRIGGDSTDWAWYPVPGLAKPNGVRVTLTRRWLAVTHTLATDLDARLILGVDLEADSHAAANGEARAFERGIGKASIEALELGNEPNLYGTLVWYVAPDGRPVFGRPPSYDFASYVGEFTSFAAGLPGPLAGPATGARSWMSLTSQFLAVEPRVKLATVHAYPVQTCDLAPSSPIFPTVAHLLAPEASTGLADQIAVSVALAQSRHVPVRVDEMNTDSCGAAPGVSNAFVSALWALDALFEMARVGVDGVNIHTYPRATYELFTFTHHRRTWSASVAPEYYGLLMFARAAPPGSRLIPATAANAQGVKVWATRGPEGRTRVVLINEDSNRRAISLGVGGAGGLATLERLRAPSLTSTTGVTLGGQSFGNRTTSGRLAGRPGIAVLRATQGHYVFALAADSAALVTFQR